MRVIRINILKVYKPQNLAILMGTQVKSDKYVRQIIDSNNNKRAEVAREIINRDFNRWDINMDSQNQTYVLTSPNHSMFLADRLDSSPIKSLELTQAKTLYKMIIEYQMASGDVNLKHLRNGKSH